MRAIIKRPGEDPKRTEIQNTLAALQRAVDGPIEAITISRDCVVIVNEEGKLRGLSYNFDAKDDVIVGTAVFVNFDEDGEFEDISDRNAEVILGLLAGVH